MAKANAVPAVTTGRWYFVHPKSRMTRVFDMASMPVPYGAGWIHVSLEDYEKFRKETKSMNRKHSNHLNRSLAKCISAIQSPSPTQSKSPKTVAKKPKPKPSKQLKVQQQIPL